MVQAGRWIIDESPATYGSSLYWSAAGARYCFSPSLALNARLGFGASVLAVGLNVRL